MAQSPAATERQILAMVRESLSILCATSELARRHRDDLEGQAVEKLMRAFARQTPANPGGFVHVTVRNLLADAAARRDVSPGVLDEVAEWQGAERLVSLPVIKKEERARTRVSAMLIVELLPSEADRALVYDRFYSGLALGELGRMHGGVGEAAISNRLNRIMSTAQPVFDLVGYAPGARNDGGADHWVSLDVLSVLARLVTKAPSSRQLETRIDDTVGYLLNLAADSPAHAHAVRGIISRLTWLRRHVPGTRGGRNKVARRLVELACAYVMEPADARHDRRGVEGLLDDARLVEAVQWVVRRNETVKD